MARSREDLELESRFVGIFRRMWITYTVRNTLQVIVFPVDPHGMYHIFTRTNAQIFRKIESEDGRKKVMDIDYIEKMIRDEINKDEFFKYLFKTQSFDLTIKQMVRYAKDRLGRELR